MGTTTEDRSEDEVSYAALLTDPRLVSVTLLSIVGTLGVNLASPALPSMGPALGVSDATIGLVVTAYTLPAMVMVPVAGVLADMYGRRTVVVPSLALFGLGGAGIAFVDSFGAVLLLRGVQGVAFAGIMPLSVTILGDIYGGVTGSAAQGIRVGANGISGVLSPAIAGILAAASWNYPFLVYALALPVAVVTYVVLPETNLRTEVPAGIAEPLREYAGTLRIAVGERQLSTLLAGGGVRDFVRYALITFVPLFAVRTLDASFAEAGALLSVRGVAYVFVSPFAGAIVATVSRRWALVGAMALGAAGMALIPTAPSVVWVGAAVLLYSVGDSVFSPVIKNAVTDASPEESRAGVVGGMNVLKYGAQTASPAFFGLVLAASGFDAVFAIGAVISGVYALAVVVLLD